MRVPLCFPVVYPRPLSPPSLFPGARGQRFISRACKALSNPTPQAEHSHSPTWLLTRCTLLDDPSIHCSVGCPIIGAIYTRDHSPSGLVLLVCRLCPQGYLSYMCHFVPLCMFDAVFFMRARRDRSPLRYVEYQYAC